MNDNKGGATEKQYDRSKRNTFLYLKKKLNYTTPKEVQERLKKQAKIISLIKKALKSGPKTVPEIASETGLDTHTVFWYIATMLRYMEVEMVEKDDEGYWKYRLKS